MSRFTLFYEEEDFLREFKLDNIPRFPPRYNIAPGQPIPIITHDPETNRNQLLLAYWGFIPTWANDIKTVHKPSNARAETLLEKTFFRNAFKHHRCLIPANGFYEWDKRTTPSTPLRYCLENDGLLAFAGLSSHWHYEYESGGMLTCSLITTASNELVSPVHDRMPVILQKDEYEQWLDRNASPENLLPLLQPREVPGLACYPVSTYVNDARHKDQNCIQRV